jgi:hypothetical protein
VRHYRPDIHDFFPKLRRGHGSTHGKCVNSACSTHRRQAENGATVKGEPHLDPKANVEDWKEERGYHKDTPLEFCR